MEGLHTQIKAALRHEVGSGEDCKPAQSPTQSHFIYQKMKITVHISVYNFEDLFKWPL